MLKSYRKTTYEDACNRGREILERLRAEEDFIHVRDRAAALGVDIVCDMRHTVTEDYEGGYIFTQEHEGQLPHGYALELWFDLVRDGYVLCSAGEDKIQLSYSVPVVTYVNLLLTQRFSFADYETVMQENPVCAVLEDYLDRIEDEGACPSPFVRDSLSPTAPRGEEGLIVGRENVGDGSYVEISSHPYDGTVGAEDSLYFSSDAFLPYHLFLLGVTAPAAGSAFTAPLTLSTEEMNAYAEVLEELPRHMRACRCFTELLSAVGVAAYAPPPRAEALLDEVTYLREKEFLADAARLAAHLRDCAEADTPVTLIP